MAETFVRSTLGTQVLGGRTSAPIYGFGTSTRDHREKLFVTEEHAKLNVKNKSPGPHADYQRRGACGPQIDNNQSPPIWGFGGAERFGKNMGKTLAPSPDTYTMRSSLGIQIVSEQDTTPVWGMGSSTRDNVKKVFLGDKQNAVTFQGVNSPGPAAYGINEKTCVGKQDLSVNRSMPSWGMGSLPRFKDPNLERTKKLPAPDAYSLQGAVGPQGSSTKRSAPLPGFGSSNREHMTKVFMTPQHEKINSYGKGSPGPAVYTRETSIGKQLLSTKRETPSFGFGGCDRWYTRKIADRVVPKIGPGSYNI